MASTDAFDSKPATADYTELLDRFGRVPGARRLIPAVGTRVGTYQFLVNRDDAQNESARKKKEVQDSASTARFSQPSSSV